jgi:hypothetical protein
MNLHRRRSSQPKYRLVTCFSLWWIALLMDKPVGLQTLYFWNTTLPLHLISAFARPAVWLLMFSLVIALRETLMFQHKTQDSVEYKEFLIVRHILCVKCTYLICIDLPLACAQVMKSLSLKSGVDESGQYLTVSFYCSFCYKETTETRRCRTTCATTSAISCASHCASEVATLSPDTKRLVWNQRIHALTLTCFDRIKPKQNLWLYLIRKSGTQFNQRLRCCPHKKERMHYNYYAMLKFLTYSVSTYVLYL